MDNPRKILAFDVQTMGLWLWEAVRSQIRRSGVTSTLKASRRVNRARKDAPVNRSALDLSFQG